MTNGRVYRTGSTESKTISLVSQEAKQGSLKVVLDHTPEERGEPRVRFTLDLWSHNRPCLLMRHTTLNISNETIDDMKVYIIMDFDVGGPTSYKDDIGRFQPETGLMMAYDENALWVAMSSEPRADGHEISSPTKLRINEEARDLKNNLELGPRDIATALQWNHGTMEPGESKTVNVVIVSATDADEVKKLTESMWDEFDKKIQ
jgi:hypothetical protein